MHAVSVHAPGRVELLGNHTDYNEGYVLSAAIDRGVTILGSHRSDKKIVLASPAFDAGAFECDLTHVVRSETKPWANYPLGVVRCFLEENLPIGGGFAAEISSDVPPGAGLSSSAALEVATAKLLMKLFNIHIEPMRMAKLCRRAENEFVGVHCGLLDQITSVFGRRHHAIFIDCRTEAVEPVAFPDGVELLIAHSGVTRVLSGGEYNERRARCFDAAERLAAIALRDISSADLERAKDSLPPLSYRRARHVVGENERVLRGVEFLKRGDAKSLGELMFESHESSRVHFENSTPELDALVAIAREEPGVLGSRMTGGGFGGASVSLVRRDAAAAAAANIATEYRERTGNICQTWLCETADGAH
jgi:galactokinase